MISYLLHINIDLDEKMSNCPIISLVVEGDTGLLFLWIYPSIRYGSFLYGVAEPIFIMCLFSEIKLRKDWRKLFSNTD